MNDQLQDQLGRFGGGATASTMTMSSLVLLVIGILLLFVLPRKYIIIPFLVVSIFIPYTQVFVLGGIHLNVYRIMLPFGWIRVLVGSLWESSAAERFRFNGIDKAVVLWTMVQAVCATLLWQSWPAVVNQLGDIYTVFGIYFLLRLMIRGREDVTRAIRVFAVICAICAVFMIREQLTSRNMFSVFGGVSEITQVREGRIRSQAAFAHSILAGTVGATLLPLFIGLWWQGGKARIAALLGIPSSIVMVLTSASATPLGACIASIAALCLWPLRRRMKLLRWAIALTLIGLNVVMKSPVWALIARIDFVGGNSGYHRYQLIDQAVRHFGDWWLFGAKNPSSWGFLTGDVSNAFISTAVNGGVASLIMFIAILWQAFRALGIARSAAEDELKLERLLWAFGASIFSNVIAFFGIWYFDQSILVWYAVLAMICAITMTTLARVPETTGVADERVPPWMRGRLPQPATAAVGRQPLGVGTDLAAAGFPTGKGKLSWPYRRP